MAIVGRLFVELILNLQAPSEQMRVMLPVREPDR